jgi:hypothetical protein
LAALILDRENASFGRRDAGDFEASKARSHRPPFAFIFSSSNLIQLCLPRPSLHRCRRLIMGFFGQTKRPADVPAQDHVDAEKGEQQPNVATDKYDSDSTDTKSLEARNEQEVQQHPDQVTANAHIGVQKAEATTLVWGKPALIFTYVW